MCCQPADGACSIWQDGSSIFLANSHEADEALRNVMSILGGPVVWFASVAWIVSVLFAKVPPGMEEYYEE